MSSKINVPPSPIELVTKDFLYEQKHPTSTPPRALGTSLPPAPHAPGENAGLAVCRLLEIYSAVVHMRTSRGSPAAGKDADTLRHPSQKATEQRNRAPVDPSVGSTGMTHDDVVVCLMAVQTIALVIMALS